MAKEKRTVVDVDEEIIQSMMSGDLPRMVPQKKQETVAQEESQPEPELPQEAPPQEKTTVQDSPARPKKKKAPQDYSGLFLESKQITLTKRQTYINAELMDKITDILAVIAKGVTMPTFLDNVLTHHLETYRDEINELYLNKTKTPL